MATEARRRFVGWLRWYMASHPDAVPSQAELARKLGISPSALTYLLAPGSDRSPSFETLVAARALTGVPVDVLLFCDPPL